MVKEKLLSTALRREEKYLSNHSSILEGKKLAGEIQQSLELQEKTDRNKSRRQFEDWNKNVYGAVQTKINARLDSETAASLNARRRNEFQKFLDTTNTKGAIFRDIIIESEYDPLLAHQKLLKYTMSDQNDPLKLEINNAEIGKPKRELGAPSPPKGLAACAGQAVGPPPPSPPR